MGDMTVTLNGVTIQRCGWCNMFHVGACPVVQEIEYFPNGTIKRVVYREATPTPESTNG